MVDSFSAGSTTRDTASVGAGGLGGGRDGASLRGGAGFQLAPAPAGVPGTNRGIFQNIMDAIAARTGLLTRPAGGFLTDIFSGITGQPPSFDTSPGGVVNASDLEALGPGGEGRGGGFGRLISGRRQEAAPPVPFSQTPEFANLLAQIRERRAAATAAVPTAPAAAAAPPALNFGRLITGG